MFPEFPRDLLRSVYYETVEGECPVKEFIDSRNIKDQAKILSLISYLQQKGPTLPRPYADLLKDGIHEPRVRLSGDQIRVLYFFSYRRFIVLTHSFMKTPARVPRTKIEKAKRSRVDFLSRFRKSDLKEINDDV